MFLLTIFEVSKGVAESIWTGYTICRGRNVSLGIVRLASNAPFGYHWAVKVDNYYWKPNWFEVEGKISYAQWYATTKIASSKGGKSLLGAQPFQNIGVTNKTDDEIEDFNAQWSKEHPDYSILTENCQMYASDLIKYLCGPDVENCLPWQEGQVVKQTSLISMGGVTCAVIVYGAYWAINKFLG